MDGWVEGRRKEGSVCKRHYMYNERGGRFDETSRSQWYLYLKLQTCYLVAQWSYRFHMALHMSSISSHLSQATLSKYQLYVIIVVICLMDSANTVTLTLERGGAIFLQFV